MIVRADQFLNLAIDTALLALTQLELCFNSNYRLTIDQLIPTSISNRLIKNWMEVNSDRCSVQTNRFLIISLINPPFMDL